MEFMGIFRTVSWATPCGHRVGGPCFGQRKEHKETWWSNKEVEQSIQRKKLAKKKYNER